MRLSLISVMAMVVIATPGLGAPTPSAAPADPHASVSPALPEAVPAPAAVPRRHGPTVVEHYVDLKSASRKELMALPGIGKAEADRIIANRPYLVKTELVSKNVLTVGPFLSIKYLVVAMPKSVTQAKH
jgi:competence protein ComEA